MPADRLFHPKLGHSQKIALLTDLEFRVWAQYILTADDFGVMRGSAVSLQADNDALNARPAKVVQRAFDRLVTVGLIGRFEHQKRAYVFQPDWQDWQKVEYPRATIEPMAPVDQCTVLTRALLEKYPGGKQQKKPPKDSAQTAEGIPNDLGNSPNGLLKSENDLENSATTRAGAPAKRLTANANGERLTANGAAFPMRPLNLGLRRLKVWRWMLDSWIAALGEHSVTFDITEWLQQLDGRVSGVLPSKPWEFLNKEFEAEVKRRGLAVAGATPESSAEWGTDLLAQMKREGVL